MVTEAGKVLGTPQYMAPEQKERPEEVDHRADIYALGVVFYQMLTGELPGERLEAPSKKVRVDVRLDEIVLRALEKEPELRFQQASVMKTRLDAMDGEEGNKLRSKFAYFEYKSRTTIFGLPLLHVSGGQDPETGGIKVAKGIVAIGERARGVLAFGGHATGGLAVGGVAVGVFAYGGIAIGLGAFGGIAIALGIALGGLAVGPVAVGGSSVGYYSCGASAHGVHALGGNVRDAEAERFFVPWVNELLANLGAFTAVSVLLVALISVGLPVWLYERQRRRESGGKNRVDERPVRPGAIRWRRAFGVFVATFALTFLLVLLLEVITGRVWQSKPDDTALDLGLEVEEASLHLPNEAAPHIVSKEDLPAGNRMEVRRVSDDDPDAGEVDQDELDQARREFTLQRNRFEAGIISLTELEEAEDRLMSREIQATRQSAETLDRESVRIAYAYRWLALIDAGNYRETYASLASLAAGAVTEDQWGAAIMAARKPLGELRSRRFRKTEAMTSVPGLPDGEYVIFQFATAFENKKEAIETFVLMKEGGDWKPVGYFIQ